MRRILRTLVTSSHLSQTQSRPQIGTRTLSFTSKSHHGNSSRTQHEINEEDEEKVDGRAKFQLHKSRGQHILTNPRVLDFIVNKAQVMPTDTVLEIGPGTGNLTVRLLESARRVVAVEIDERMIETLEKRVKGLGLKDKLTIISEDVLKAHLPQFDICVANIPYGISSPLIAKLLFGPTRPSFRSTTLLLQKEFAQRLMAKPGDSEFNRLAVNVGLVATVEFLVNVSKKDFVPCPKVDSALVRIRQRPELPVVDINEWLSFTRTCFSNRNKTLGAIFKQKKKILELFIRTPESATNFRVLEEDHDSDEGDDRENDMIGLEDVDREERLEVSQFKEKIFGILKIKGFDKKRPSKMSHEELLDLLRLFNQQGVLFNS